MKARLPRSRWAAVAISLAAIAAVAGITLGVTTLLGVTFQGEGEVQQGDASTLREGLLNTANRDRLAMCVQAVGGDSSMEPKGKASIEKALVEVAKHPRWEAAGLGVAPPVVDTVAALGVAARGGDRADGRRPDICAAVSLR